jgi:DNA mismatch repair protein MutH
VLFRSRAHELSGGDTYYLEASPKGADSSSLRKQPYSSEKAMQRGLALKPRYLKVVIKILTNKYKDSAPIIKDISEYPKNKNFEDIVKERFKPYIDFSVDDIHKNLNFRYPKTAKNYYAYIARAIMGVNKRNIEEFDKADVVMKIIRLKKDGMPKESMSFPAIKYADIVKEGWENSTLKSMFSKKFFFVIFKYDKEGALRLFKVMFWNMPYSDLEKHVRSCWFETVRCIIGRRAEYLPKISENAVCHVRPHAKNKADTYMTHYGVKVKKQSFWLNASYLKGQIAMHENKG